MKFNIKVIFFSIWLTVALAHFGSAYFFKWFVREERLNRVEHILVHVDYYDHKKQDIFIDVIDSEMVILIKRALLSGEFVAMPNKTGNCILDATLIIENGKESHKLLYSVVNDQYGRCIYLAGGWDLGTYDDTLLAPILIPLVKAHCKRDSLQ